jgi:hypothetical protein
MNYVQGHHEHEPHEHRHEHGHRHKHIYMDKDKEWTQFVTRKCLNFGHSDIRAVS